MSLLKINKQTPFTPETEVNIDDFVGREEVLNNILRYLPNIMDGRNRHFFVVGKRGMGKSSLSYYLQYVLEKYDIVPVKISNDGVEDIYTLVYKIVDVLLNKIGNESWADKIMGGFGENIERTGFHDLKIKFKPQNKDFVNALIDDFPLFIKDICSNLEDKKGIFIIIDDIDGLSKTPRFVNWYKSFVDSMTMRFDGETPVAFLLTSSPETLEKLKKHNPSFSRIFYHNDIEELSYDETVNFYKKSFDRVNMCYSDESIDLLAKYCYGVPLMMQELGEMVFWQCQDNNITTSTSIYAIQDTNQVIANKYLSDFINNEIYHHLFNRIGKIIIPTEDTFSIEKLKENTTHEEKELIDIFISEAQKEQVIIREQYGKKDKCTFINPLYSIYLRNKNLH